jgi:hypothetical protein
VGFNTSSLDQTKADTSFRSILNSSNLIIDLFLTLSDSKLHSKYEMTFDVTAMRQGELFIEEYLNGGVTTADLVHIFSSCVCLSCEL